MTEPACPACAGQWPSSEYRIVDCGLTVAYLHDDQFFPGWTYLVLKRHATELWQLTRDERAALIERYEAGPAVLRAAFERVPAAARQWRPAPVEWSAHDCAVPQCALARHRVDVRTGGVGRGC